MAIGNFVQVCLGWASCGGWLSPIRGGGAATGGGGKSARGEFQGKWTPSKLLNKGCFQTPGDKYTPGKAKSHHFPLSSLTLVYFALGRQYFLRNLIKNLCTDFEHVHRVGRLQIPRWNLAVPETKGGEILPNTWRNTLKFNPILFRNSNIAIPLKSGKSRHTCNLSKSGDIR